MRLTQFSIRCCAVFLLLNLAGCGFKPNPAAESRKHALAEHPQLGVEGSAFNWAFVELYRRLLAEKSPRLLSKDWPMDLATEVSYKLKMAGAPDPSGKRKSTTSSSLNDPPTRVNFRWR